MRGGVPVVRWAGCAADRSIAQAHKRIAEAERKAQLAADKLKKLKSEQAAREARQRVIEAKLAKAAESRRIQEVGAVVKRAGLLDLDNTTLLGVLLIASDKLGDLAYLAEARERGALANPAGTAARAEGAQ